MRKLLPIILIFICSTAYAQVEAYSENGDTIILFDNKTWENKKQPSLTQSDIEITVKATVKIDDFSNAKTASTNTWVRWGTSDAGWSSTYLSGKARAAYVQDVNVIIFDITYSGDLGCLSRSSEMIVKLSNGELVTLYNFGDTDCGSDSQKGMFSPVDLTALSDMSSVEEFQSMVDETIIKLRDNDIDKIKLTGSKYYTEQIPNDKFSSGTAKEFFRQHIWALQKVL